MTTYTRLADLLAAITVADASGQEWTAGYRCWPGPPTWTFDTWQPGQPPPLPIRPTDGHLSVAEAAAALGLSERMVKKAARAGTLAADLVAQTGTRQTYRISREAVEAYRHQRLGRRGRPRQQPPPAP